ncbi:YciI family protein [Paucibacter sp. B2R-40]|uniref:YciI family protein n=1 Tax=Paucibacter sp. B2R-40 TaxID=2893554 RepID=UPI0021E4E317|nr:YciI family protein [Paucibacter sp. B2R-40]MCV2355280.1 YciI family protein [Paucibacter sp. B2R-40]
MRMLLASLALCLPWGLALAQAQPPSAALSTTSTTSPIYNAEMASAVGADDYGMKKYVLVVLKTGPSPMPAGAERSAMFKGHFANINRLAAEGKLALAGPFDGVDGWRGLFILAVSDIEEAKQLTQTDPVISSGEMVAEYHKYYGSAALMLVNDAHKKLAKKSF